MKVQETSLTHSTKASGFTLIELLVVIAIMGLLASVVLASVSSARTKSRDTTRKTELKQMQNALELYFNDNNSYPSTGGNWFSSEPGDIAGDNGGNYIPGLASNYIPVLPRDPLGGASSITVCSAGSWKRAYVYYSDGSHYVLLSHCAPENTWTSSDSFYDPVRTTWAWKVYSDPVSRTW